MLQNDEDGADRRRFYRIHDEIGLRYRVVAPEEAAAVLERLQNRSPDKLALTASFAASTGHMRRVMDKVRRDLPDVATYLEGLNEKLDLLIRLLVSTESDLPDHPTHDVSLSAAGLSFHVAEPLSPGVLMELKLLIFPNYFCLDTLAEVIRCDWDSDAPEAAPYLVAVDFAYIREDERELLIRHVIQKQSSMLREARALAEQQPHRDD